MSRSSTLRAFVGGVFLSTLALGTLAGEEADSQQQPAGARGGGMGAVPRGAVGRATRGGGMAGAAAPAARRGGMGQAGAAAEPLADPAATEAKIRRALQTRTTLEFIETEMSVALQFLSDLHGIQILLDPSAHDMGVTSDTVLSAELRNISLRSALRILLREHDLTFIIEDEVLKIVSLDAAEERLKTQVIDVGHVAKAINGGIPAEKLIAVIECTIAPTSWDEVGGVGVISALGDLLVVSNTEEVIEQVESLLNQLSEKLPTGCTACSDQCAAPTEEAEAEVDPFGTPAAPAEEDEPDDEAGETS